jgi:hypothetical protein
MGMMLMTDASSDAPFFLNDAHVCTYIKEV